MTREDKFMKKALSLAAKGKGMTYPNPAVGCIMVYRNKIIGQGFHKIAGGPHAEIAAFNSVKRPLPDGTEMFVTLEPCSHTGKTPPCTEAIIRSGIQKVFIGSADPNPLVKGSALLKNRGITVTSGILQRQCDELNEDFFHFIKTGTPFVTVKCALTLDGKIATRSGNSKWISNEKSRRFAHYLRKINSAMVIGINTILLDNPSLNIRAYPSDKKHVDLIILDTRLRFKQECNVMQANPPETIHLVTSPDNKNTKKARQLSKAGIDIIYISLRQNRIHLKKLLAVLGKRGYSSLLVEGGGEVIGNFFENKLVNKANIIYAPKILGGKNSRTIVSATEKNNIADSTVLDEISVRRFGDNIMVSGYVYRDN